MRKINKTKEKYRIHQCFRFCDMDISIAGTGARVTLMNSEKLGERNKELAPSWYVTDEHLDFLSQIIPLSLELIKREKLGEISKNPWVEIGMNGYSQKTPSQIRRIRFNYSPNEDHDGFKRDFDYRLEFNKKEIRELSRRTKTRERHLENLVRSKSFIEEKPKYVSEFTRFDFDGNILSQESWTHE